MAVRYDALRANKGRRPFYVHALHKGAISFEINSIFLFLFALTGNVRLKRKSFVYK